MTQDFCSVCLIHHFFILQFPYILVVHIYEPYTLLLFSRRISDAYGDSWKTPLYKRFVQNYEPSEIVILNLN